MCEDIHTNRDKSVNNNNHQLVSYHPIGKGWTTHFLQRDLCLGSTISQQLDLAQWNDPTRGALSTWFNVYNKVIQGIPPRNHYNMNETGVAIGEEESTRIIINNQMLQTCYRMHPGCQK